MRNYSTATENYRAGRNEFAPVDLLSIRVRDRDTGDPKWFHFSSRVEDETIQVRNQSTGDLEFRDYFGGGHIVALDPLIRSEGTGVRNFSVTLSGVSDPVRDMVYGYDCRDAVFERHIGEEEQGTGLLVDTPVCEFEGFVDTGDLEDGAVDMTNGQPSDSTIKLSVVSHIAALQRTNPDMRSPEVGRDRSGDDILQYAPESNTWDALWGKEGKKHKKHGNGDGRDQHRGDDSGWGHSR